MKKIERLRYLESALLAIAVGCAPVVDYPDAEISLSFNSTATRESNLTGSGGVYSLDPNLCYLIHATAAHPEFNQAPTHPPGMPPSELAQCPQMPPHFGRWFGTLTVGQEIEIAVPAIPQMKFDLLATPRSSFGGTCPAGFSLLATPDPQNPGHSHVSPQINGVEIPETWGFGPDSIFIVGTVTADIVPGLNQLSLTAIPDPANPSQLGRLYFCDDGGGGNSGGSNTNNVVYLSSPAYVHPEMSGSGPATWRTSMSVPFGLFNCPLGTSQVSLAIQGLAAQVATCGAHRPDKAFFPNVQMPSGWGTSTFVSQASFVGLDSNSTPIGTPFNFQISFGPAYRTLCDVAYGNTCIQPSGLYGQYDGMFPGPEAVKFVGFRSQPGDRGIFLKRDENASKKLIYIPLDDVEGSMTINPFGWDSARSILFSNYTEAGNQFHYSDSTEEIWFANNSMTSSLFRLPFSLGSASPFTNLGSTSPHNFNFSTNQDFGFAGDDNYVVFSGLAAPGPSPSTWLSPTDNFANAFQTRLSGSNVLGNFGQDRKMIFHQNQAGGFVLGSFVKDISVGNDRLSLITCQELASCRATGGGNNWTLGQLSNATDIVDVLVTPDAGSTSNFKFWILRESHLGWFFGNSSASFQGTTPPRSARLFTFYRRSQSPKRRFFLFSNASVLQT